MMLVVVRYLEVPVTLNRNYAPVPNKMRHH